MGDVLKLLLLGLLALGGLSTVKCERREYYLGAVELDWDYVPSQANRTEETSQNNKTTFRKIAFRQFTDESFAEKTKQSPALGYFGPVLVAEVGDTIQIHFRNYASVPLSVTADGVQTLDNTTNPTLPGEKGEYSWTITASHAPSHVDPVCTPRLYYSDVNLNKDFNSGATGCLLVCKEYGIPSRKEMKNVIFFAITDEKKSWLHDEDESPDKEWLRYSINGYSYNTFPTPPLCMGETQTWYILGVSPFSTVFPVQFSGLTVQVSSKLANVVTVYPGTHAVVMITTPPSRGRWQLFSSFNEHQINGMTAYAQVHDCTGIENFQWIPGANNQLGVDEAECPETDTQTPNSLTTRTYYVAAEEYLWNYAPHGYDFIIGDRLNQRGSVSYSKFEPGLKRIGGRYKKVHFVEYTDPEFTEIKTRPKAETHLGFLGPVLRVEVNEILKVVFKNKASRPYSISIPDMERRTDFVNEAVQPLQMRTYKWILPQTLGPTERDAQCRTSMYYSSLDFVRDTASGLYGPLLLCRRGSLNADNSQKNIDDELFLLFGAHDENYSWYIDDNLRGATGESEENFPALKTNSEFRESNLMFAINGYAYGHNTGIEEHSDEIAGLHLMCIGDYAHNLEIVNQSLTDGFYSENAASHLHVFSSVSLTPWSHQTVYMLPRQSGKFNIIDYNWKAYLDGLKGYMTISEHRGSTTRYSDTKKPKRFSVIRMYYIAAVEVEWEYNSNSATNHSINSYKKVMYQEFADETFTKRKVSNAHAGIIGPEIRAEAGDIIKITFQNQGCRPHSIHPKGLRFEPSDAGEWVLKTEINDETNFQQFQPQYDDPGIVWPGRIHIYTWYVPDEMQNSTRAAKCSPSYYYSAVDPVRDVQSGLFGPILICERGHLSKAQNDINKKVIPEYFLFLKSFDETASWYNKENLERFPEDIRKNPNNVGMTHYTMNGLDFGTLSEFEVPLHEYVIWHVVNLDPYLHSVNFERNLVVVETELESGKSGPSATRPLHPGEACTFVMVTLQSGTWKIRDFATNNTENGMFCYYHVMQPGCQNPLGMQSGVISKGQITASSMYVTKGLFGLTTGRWKPGNARLHNGGHHNGWIPARFDRRPWLQIDLGSPMQVSGIILQGVKIGLVQKYVKIFRILYSVNRKEWFYAKRLWSDNPMSFSGNDDSDTPVTREFIPHLFARYIKIMVHLWHNQPALRIEILGCKLKGGCESHLGIEWTPDRQPRIPDDALSSSSVYFYKRALRWEPKYGRLNYKPNGWRDTAPSWSPSKSNRREWIQVDLGERMFIRGVITQGASYKTSSLFVKSYRVQYSETGYEWVTFTDNDTGRKKIFRGNFDSKTALTQTFGDRIVARYLRIQPWSWSGRIALRFEVIGCRIGDSAGDGNDVEEVPPFPEECISDLVGMQPNDVKV